MTKQMACIVREDTVKKEECVCVSDRGGETSSLRPGGASNYILYIVVLMRESEWDKK